MTEFEQLVLQLLEKINDNLKDIKNQLEEGTISVATYDGRY